MHSLFSNVRTLRRRANHSLLLIFCGLLFSVAASAQTPQFYVGGGTGGNAIPFSPSTSMASFSKWQGFYLAGQFTGAYGGVITKVYFQSYSSYAATTYSNPRISLGQSTSSTFSTTAWYTPMTQCFSATSASIPAVTANQWFSFTLQTPFAYNPGQHLIIEFCSDGHTGGGPSVLTGAGTNPPNIHRMYGGSGCSGTVAGAGAGTLSNFGFDLASPYNVDAGIQSLLSPVNFCASTQNIDVKLMNYGKNTLSNVTIKWTYDGTPQSDIAWTGALAALTSQNVTLGSRSFAAGVPHTLRVWTSQPNSTSDSGAFNDTLNAVLKPALSGTFTIGGASPSYATFAAAAADLTANGVCGPVIFNVRPGTYTEQVNIGQVNGASSTNTITFQPENGIPTSVTLTYGSTTATNYTLGLNGADFVTFKNMIINATGTTYGVAVQVAGGANDNTIQGCQLSSPIGAYTGTNNAVVYSPSGSVHSRNKFIGNTINGGAFSFYWWGGSTTAMDTATVFDGNIMTNMYYMGAYLYYQYAPIIKNNFLTHNSAYTVHYGWYAYYLFGPFEFTGNKVNEPNNSGTSYGALIYSSGWTGNASSYPLWANNFISIDAGASTAYGLYMYYQSYAKAYHNTINLRSTYSTSAGMYVYYGDNIQLRNNIVYCPSGAMPYYWYPNTNILAADRNIFYSTGTYFGYYNGTYYANLAAWQTATLKESLSKSTTITFANPATCDLHLAGASQYDPNLTSVILPEVPKDIDGDVRVIPYIGADEACYILPAQVKFEIRDGNGQKASYVEIPGTIYLYYDVNFPNTAASITATVKLYNAVTNALVYSSNFSFNKPAGSPAQGTQAIPIPGNLPSGAYKTEVVYNMPNSCGFYIDWIAGTAALLAVPQGSVPCVVWPGDVNNDGLVNFGDRSGLDKYISNANLRATWLQGPARYRTDFATNPLTYYTWEGQASVPWATPEGCYMDSDGNGMINNMDHLAIKLNWMKKHGAPKAGEVESFDVAQNYPNPFNPMTTIRYTVPERSRVSIVVTDMLGRTVATLVNGTIESGSHTATFDGSQLESGGYMATVSMTGEESGLTFTKTLKMSLVK